jgi:glycerol-3-phosphate O-acyltransferase
LTGFLQGPDPSPEALGVRLMAEIAQALPVLPVPLVAACLPATDRASLIAACQALADRLAAQGRVMKLAPQGIETTVTEALAILDSRGLIRGLIPVESGRPVLAYYAASLQQGRDTMMTGERL